MKLSAAGRGVSSFRRCIRVASDAVLAEAENKIFFLVARDSVIRLQLQPPHCQKMISVRRSFLFTGRLLLRGGREFYLRGFTPVGCRRFIHLAILIPLGVNIFLYRRASTKVRGPDCQIK